MEISCTQRSKQPLTNCETSADCNISLNMKEIQEESVEKCKTPADAVIKLYSKIAKLERTANSMLKPKTKVKIVTEKKAETKSTTSKSSKATFKDPANKTASKQPSKPAVSATKPVSKKKENSKPAETTTTATGSSSSTPRSNGLKSHFNLRPKILYVADSVGQTAAMPIIENGQSRVVTAKAYSSVYDVKARWPKCNFRDVVKNRLENPGQDSFDVLVMSAPTVDISNLDTSNLRPKDNTEMYQQKVIESSNNMFKIAKQSLELNPNLSNVVIMEHPPRFDSKMVDPTTL